MKALGPGDRIERYVIEAPLGEGGMGRVYRALDERLDRRIALKVLLTRADEDREGRARLLREARAAAALDHPNVVQVYDVGEVEDGPFIAMELVLGRSLRSMIGDPAVPMGERLRVLRGVAEGLAAAHDARLVHRDVKPENVIVREDGRVKVLDFGIARRTRESSDPSAPTGASLSTLTAEGVKLGTPMYMAPEQIRGGQVDGRTDQFAWGVTAYELLTGRPPFVASDSMALMAAIITDAPPPLGDDVPPEVARVVLQALEKSPAARFASMHEVGRALAEHDRRAPASGPSRVEAAGRAGVTDDRRERDVPAAPRGSVPPRGPRPSSAPPEHRAARPSTPAPRVAPPALSRRYSPKELEEILDRALRLQPDPAPTGYRYEEVAAAAREVGVDEPTLLSAMRDMVKRGAVTAPETDRLRSRARLQRHAGVWGAFAAFFFFINLFDNVFGNGREWWFEFPVVSWGVFVAVHAVFHFFPSPKTSRPLARHTADPSIEADARAVGRYLAERPRARFAVPHEPPIDARDEAALQAEREADADLEAARDGRARHT